MSNLNELSCHWSAQELSQISKSMLNSVVKKVFGLFALFSLSLTEPATFLSDNSSYAQKIVAHTKRVNMHFNRTLNLI